MKFQRHSPAICVPAERQQVTRDMPCRIITYVDHKERLDFWGREIWVFRHRCGWPQRTPEPRTLVGKGHRWRGRDAGAAQRGSPCREAL
jgi:hypothetical protein